jgi:DNA-binding response OmpR family regulator
MTKTAQEEKSGRGKPFFSSKSHAPRILYVDDNEDHLFLVKEWIQKEHKNFQIDLERSGHHALRKAKIHFFDLILLDYKLEDLDGLQLLRDLKREGVKTPIVMLTGQGDEHTAVQAIKWGARDYVCKGAENFGELIRVIENILSD